MKAFPIRRRVMGKHHYLHRRAQRDSFRCWGIEAPLPALLQYFEQEPLEMPGVEQSTSLSQSFFDTEEGCSRYLCYSALLSFSLLISIHFNSELTKSAYLI